MHAYTVQTIEQCGTFAHVLAFYVWLCEHQPTLPVGYQPLVAVLIEELDQWLDAHPQSALYTAQHRVAIPEGYDHE